MLELHVENLRFFIPSYLYLNDSESSSYRNDTATLTESKYNYLINQQRLRLIGHCFSSNYKMYVKGFASESIISIANQNFV